MGLRDPGGRHGFFRYPPTMARGIFCFLRVQKKKRNEKRVAASKRPFLSLKKVRKEGSVQS